MRPESGSVRMTRIVSARLRASPGRASTPRIRVLVGVPSIPPDAGSSAARAAGVILAFASFTAPFRAM